MKDKIKKITQKRKKDYIKFFAAFLITFLIFISSFLLGFYIDKNKYEVLNLKVEKQDIDFESLQLQYLFLQEFKGNESNKCSLIEGIMNNNLKVLYPILNKILDYEKNKEENSEKYSLLLSKYNIYNTKYYLLAEKSKKECNNDIVVVLYFFNTEDKCKSCKGESYILSGLKEEFKEKLLVFPYNLNNIDNDFTLQLMAKTYNITKTPTIIVDNEIRIEKYIGKKDLKKIICEEYKNKPLVC